MTLSTNDSSKNSIEKQIWCLNSSEILLKIRSDNELIQIGQFKNLMANKQIGIFWKLQFFYK